MKGKFTSEAQAAAKQAIAVQANARAQDLSPVIAVIRVLSDRCGQAQRARQPTGNHPDPGATISLSSQNFFFRRTFLALD
jgi:hypothetical protein